MAASISDYFTHLGTPGSATSLAAPGHTIGGTTFNVDSTSLWPTDTAVIFAVDTTVSGVRVAGTYTVWRGLVTSGTAITSCTLMYGTDQNYSAGTTTRVYILPTTSRENRLVDGILVGHNQDGTHKTDTVTTASILGNAVTTAKLSTELQKGWENAYGTTTFPAPSTVTANGNRSYSLVFSGVDLTGYVSPGMRLKTTRTVSAPTYMGGLLNGTTQYFTKATPSGTLGTMTDNFTLMAWVQPTSYAGSTVCGRSDSTPANGFWLNTEPDGRVTLGVTNGGAANFKYVMTYQSLPLNKKTHVTATWASGTVAIYFDGVSVPVSSSAGSGTLPNTAGTGGDWSIGRRGAYNAAYFPGYISGVGVFNAVLSAATIRSYMSQVLSGSETNCVGAWSLNNVLTDASASANTLSAGGSASFTAISPYSTNSFGTATGTTDYAIVTASTFSTDTTLTVQVPEGNTIPTSGGVSAVSYSTQATPYGFPKDRGKWQVVTLCIANNTTASPVQNTWYEAPALRTSVPTGSWRTFYDINALAQRNGSGVASIDVSQATSSAAAGDTDMWISWYSEFSSALNSTVVMTFFREKPNTLNLTTQTTYYVNYRTPGITQLTTGIYNTQGGAGRVVYELAYL